ncbi:hypothetical protein AVEN_89746-1 [Araneus ventricosus]|uniref:Uncharacterized protein n=1 Tax=Araneus ventricosus TaxID=182803 RepID=A0A4Y2J6H9_ARAVE|nr:hypothetical protein AVEN_89746-1 [Araneus ventricosus]
MTRTTHESALLSPNFRATPMGRRLATTYDLAFNRPHTRRIFGRIGFRFRGLTTRPPRPPNSSDYLGYAFSVLFQIKHNRKRDTPVLPKHPGSQNDSSCNNSSTEAGVLISDHYAMARPLPKDIVLSLVGGNSIFTPKGSEFSLNYPAASHP